MSGGRVGPQPTSAAELATLHLGFLDWGEVLEQLATRADSQAGQQACRALAFASTRGEAEERLVRVAEAARLFAAGESFPSLAFPEIELHLEAAERGAALGAEELRQVAGFCETVAAARRAGARFGEDVFTPGPRAPLLAAVTSALGAWEHLVTAASETFDAAGEIRDSASPELFRLRRERDGLAGRARDQAEAILKSEEYAPYLQDEYVTLRQERFVLPLRASFKSMGLGIVHDTSRSGETVFIEPSRMVEINNRLKVVEIEIRRESRRILEELAAMVASSAPALREDRERLVALDVLLASARLGLAYDGRAISLTDDPALDLRELRHPLLAVRLASRPASRSQGGRQPGDARDARAGAQVIANDVALGVIPERSDARLLVVSGPNAGGKTVLLKAVGLAALLARAGLLIPAGSGSRIGFFTAVLADIGDQQSVAGDLSTFSAHLANVSAILSVAGATDGRVPADAAAADAAAAAAGAAAPAAADHVLVLLDELMSGTHPEQGAALARATLEELGAGRALVIATTHYDALKSLSEGDARFRNAGMEYDLEHLRPTFRLKDGLPGRSYALDIATRMGLPRHVLARAQALLGQTSLGLEEVLRNLEERESALTRSLEALEQARADLEGRAADQKAAAQSLAKREKELALRSREAVDAAVRDAREAISDIVREVRRRRSPEAAAEARRALEQKAAEATRELPERPALDLEKLRDALASRSLGVAKATGPASKPTGGKGAGSGGGAKGSSGAKPGSQTPSTPSPPSTPGTQSPGTPTDPELVFQTSWNTLDLRGRRADEALGELEVFLDKAVLDGADAVIVIHGHGTGALRKVVREALATSAYVQRFRAGGPREGGDGVSVVTVRG